MHLCEIEQRLCRACCAETISGGGDVGTCDQNPGGCGFRSQEGPRQVHGVAYLCYTHLYPAQMTDPGRNVSGTRHFERRYIHKVFLHLCAVCTLNGKHVHAACPPPARQCLEPTSRHKMGSKVKGNPRITRIDSGRGGKKCLDVAILHDRKNVSITDSLHKAGNTHVKLWWFQFAEA